MDSPLKSFNLRHARHPVRISLTCVCARTSAYKANYTEAMSHMSHCLTGQAMHPRASRWVLPPASLPRGAPTATKDALQNFSDMKGQPDAS